MGKLTVVLKSEITYDVLSEFDSISRFPTSWVSKSPLTPRAQGFVVDRIRVLRAGSVEFL